MSLLTHAPGAMKRLINSSALRSGPLRAIRMHTMAAPAHELCVPAYDATRALSLRGRRLLDHLR